jgi:hypothetical protein
VFEQGDPSEKAPVVDLSSSSNEEGLIADVSQDEFTRIHFGGLNRDVLGPSDDGKIIVLSDSDEKEEEVREEKTTGTENATTSAAVNPTSTVRLKKSSLGFGSLDACVSDHEQIDHRLGLFHCDLLHNLNVADSVAEGVDDLNVLDIRDSVSSIVEMFHIVPKALIMHLSNGLESLSSRWPLIRALKVSDEHGT